MSILKRITKLFVKQPSGKSFGIALQQKGINACSKFVLKNTAKSGKAQPSQPICQSYTVDLSDFEKAIIDLQATKPLSGQCHLVLNAQLSQIVQMDKPNIPHDEMVGALKWQVKDLVSISPDNMVLDYFDAPILIGGKEKIHVVCAPLGELKKLVAAVEDSNTSVASITTEEFAFANLLPIKNDACLLVCQQPNEEIIILIIKQGHLYFYRRLRGYSQLASKSEDELTMMVIDSLALEIQRSSDYFEHQLKQAGIREIKVLLPMKTEGFFARKLAENTHLPVSILALPEGYQQYRGYAAAIGATLFESRLAEYKLSQPQELS